MNCYYCGKDSYNSKPTRHPETVYGKWLLLPDDCMVPTCVACEKLTSDQVFLDFVTYLETKRKKVLAPR